MATKKYLLHLQSICVKSGRIRRFCTFQPYRRAQLNATRPIGQEHTTPTDATLHEAHPNFCPNHIKISHKAQLTTECIHHQDNDYFFTNMSRNTLIRMTSETPLPLNSPNSIQCKSPQKQCIPIMLLEHCLPLIILFAPITKTASPTEQLAVAENTIAHNGLADLHIYTDGSTSNGTQNGDGGVGVIYQDGGTMHL